MAVLKIENRSVPRTCATAVSFCKAIQGNPPCNLGPQTGVVSGSAIQRLSSTIAGSVSAKDVPRSLATRRK